MRKTTIQLETLTCPSCVRKIESVIGPMNGVDTVKVLFHQSKVKIHFDEMKTSAPQLVETIENLGYATKGSKEA